MIRARLIPILAIEGPNPRLVKTVKFKKPNYLGDPINAIKIFNDKMVDEIVVLDITASREDREPNYDLIYEMAGECFSPLGYGGGIKTIEQAEKIFSLGVEKVILNTSTSTAQAMLTEVSRRYGAQSVVASIDVKKKLLGKQRPHILSGTKSLDQDIVVFAQKMVEIGAGEIVIQDVDRDGTFSGINFDLTKSVCEAVSVPVIACGGTSSIENARECIAETGASAVAAGSLFAYRGNNTNSIMINYPTQEDLIVS